MTTPSARSVRRMRLSVPISRDRSFGPAFVTIAPRADNATELCGCPRVALPRGTERAQAHTNIVTDCEKLPRTRAGAAARPCPRVLPRPDRERSVALFLLASHGDSGRGRSTGVSERRPRGLHRHGLLVTAETTPKLPGLPVGSRSRRTSTLTPRNHCVATADTFHASRRAD